MKKGLSALILSAALLNLAPLAFSQVEPEKTDIKLTIKPGEKIGGTILLQNDSDKDILVKAYFEDLVYPPPFEGIREARPLGSSPWSFGEWASVTPSDFILPASGKVPVQYTFDVPAAAKGGYYGVLLFERGSKASEGAGLGIDLKIRTGTKFFLETIGKKRAGRIEDIILEKEGMQSELSNTGDVLLDSKVSWHIMNAKGRVVKRGEFARCIPPGEKSSFSVAFPGDFPAGEYTLFINCNFGEKKPLIKEVDFVREDSAEVRVLRQKD